jgi:hypothetical protein
MEFDEGGGIAEIATLALAAVGLDLAKMIERLLELAGESLAVQSERGEKTVGVNDIECDGGFFVRWVGGAAEQIGFEQWDTVDAPGGYHVWGNS